MGADYNARAESASRQIECIRRAGARERDRAAAIISARRQ
jgi:hypothetical protein